VIVLLTDDQGEANDGTEPMKPAAGRPKTQRAPVHRKSNSDSPTRIHPVVIYPIQQPADYTDLKALYQLIVRLDGEPDQYTRPITVLDRKTHHRNSTDPAFLEFRKSTVARCSDILDAWCVDTCQMWYTGLGRAFEQGQAGDIYWLIPGDFNYGSGAGQEVLSRLEDLPAIVAELGQDLCIGEITTDHNHPKQLIDTYGTFALLYNWFPDEAKEIRQVTERPRSEFFALNHEFLREMLQERWYAYEQTVVILLRAIMNGKRISRFIVGAVSDLPEGRESLNSALQQIERTERLLKSLWRERHAEAANWTAQYQALEAQSEATRKSALVLLHQLLASRQ
jgi:hypothetical protein